MNDDIQHIAAGDRLPDGIGGTDSNGVLTVAQGSEICRRNLRAPAAAHADRRGVRFAVEDNRHDAVDRHVDGGPADGDARCRFLSIQLVIAGDRIHRQTA